MLSALGYYHNQVKATLEAVKSYRSFYPTGTLVMINDGGKQEIGEIATQYNAIYHPYTKNLGTGVDLDDIEVMIEWMDRFFKAIACIPEEYFVILEDDVKFFQAIHPASIVGDLFGYNPSNLLPEKVTAYLKQYNSKITTPRIWYGGAGGCIGKTETFKRIAQEDWKTQMRVYGELTKRYAKNQQSWYFNDCCVSYLCWRYGGEVCQNEAWDEFHRASIQIKLREGKLAIGHFYKEFYNR
jgi:hypothetical protein